MLGPEFGSDAGKKAIIVHALYGLKSAGGSFGQHITDCMRTLGCKSCKVDSDLWYKPMVRPEDGYEYYAYILLYIDDCLTIASDPTAELNLLNKYIQMKKGSIGDPGIYLGNKQHSVRLNNDVEAWSLSSSKSVQDAVKNVKQFILEKLVGRMLPKQVTVLWQGDYCAELDTSAELDHDLANYYLSQIGVLHWIIKLGQVDIITEVSILASQMAYHVKDTLTQSSGSLAT